MMFSQLFADSSPYALAQATIRITSKTLIFVPKSFLRELGINQNYITAIGVLPLSSEPDYHKSFPSTLKSPIVHLYGVGHIYKPCTIWVDQHVGINQDHRPHFFCSSNDHELPPSSFSKTAVHHILPNTTGYYISVSRPQPSSAHGSTMGQRSSYIIQRESCHQKL